MEKQVSPSAERNKEPILQILKKYLTTSGRLLEIGSGTGQHAVYFANYFNHIHWITSDLKDNHKVISEYLHEAKLKNVHGPELLKVGRDNFPLGTFNFVFTANTLHIMSWKENKAMFKQLGLRLRAGALVFFYGPFKYESKFTSQSNEDFDVLLKSSNVKSGIRSFEDVTANMKKAGFKLLKDHKMPANNRILVYERTPVI